MTNSQAVERQELIDKIIQILRGATDEDLKYYMITAQTLATRALINQESDA